MPHASDSLGIIWTKCVVLISIVHGWLGDPNQYGIVTGGYVIRLGGL